MKPATHVFTVGGYAIPLREPRPEKRVVLKLEETLKRNRAMWVNVAHQLQKRGADTLAHECLDRADEARQFLKELED